VQQSEGEGAGDDGFTDAVKEIASKDRILDWFLKALEACGVVGEEKIAKLCYLALTSRVLERPVSLAVKGPSSGGKSYVTGQVLRFFQKVPITLYRPCPIEHWYIPRKIYGIGSLFFLRQKA
jgi:hypothetical protein